MSNSDDDNFTVPTDPAIKQKIRQAIQEASAQMQMIDDRKEAIKDIATHVEDTYEIPKKIFTKMVKVHHKQNYNNVLHEDTQFQTYYENIVGDGSTP